LFIQAVSLLSEQIMYYTPVTVVDYNTTLVMYMAWITQQAWSCSGFLAAQIQIVAFCGDTVQSCCSGTCFHCFSVKSLSFLSCFLLIGHLPCNLLINQMGTIPCSLQPWR